MIQAGTKIKSTEFESIYIVTSVTEKRINLDEPNVKYTTSTGRSSSKFWVGHKLFKEFVENGKWVVMN